MEDKDRRGSIHTGILIIQYSSQLGAGGSYLGSADPSIDDPATCNGTGTPAEHVTVTLACGAPIRCLWTGCGTDKAALCEHVSRSALVAYGAAVCTRRMGTRTPALGPETIVVMRSTMLAQLMHDPAVQQSWEVSLESGAAYGQARVPLHQGWSAKACYKDPPVPFQAARQAMSRPHRTPSLWQSESATPVAFIDRGPYRHSMLRSLVGIFLKKKCAWAVRFRLASRADQQQEEFKETVFFTF